MYKPVKDGTKTIIQGIECWIPPVGYGVDRMTGELVHIGVHSESTKKSEQKWKRLLLPKDYDKRRQKEFNKQLDDPDYFDPELEAIREKHWTYRRCGYWFKNNGVETYITGTHWYYLNWCATNVGYMDYRNTDRRIFYCMASVEDDPRAGGLVYVSRRRGGKTYIAGAWMLDRVSLGLDKIGGIQSKTDEDAKLVFNKTIINYFVNLPHFFKPIYDTSQGLRPKKELRFYKPTIRGKNSDDMLDGDELRSLVNFGSSEPFHYDGNALYAYILDEFGKPQRSNVWDTWNVVRYCMDQDGNWVGKAFVTSTIEDIDVTGNGPKDIWKNSDQENRDANGRTTSGLYRLFFGAHESTFFDAFGNEDSEKGLSYYNNMRKGFAHDTRQLSSIIRKNPFTIEEAFRVDGEHCLYDAMKLNERLDRLSWKENVTTRGNFVWENGVRDSRVVWEPHVNGKFEVVKLFEEEAMSNKVHKRGDLWYPNNTLSYCGGVDPIDHSATQDNRRSNGAGIILQKYSPVREDIYNRAFVCKYVHRPDIVSVFYEDMIKMAVYYGCHILFENNKIGMLGYFNERGYGNFLMWLPDRQAPGIAATPRSHQYGAELTEEYINSDVDKVYFKDLLKDWLEFDLSNTTKFDIAMAASYALMAEKAITTKQDKSEVREVKEYFRSYKIPRR
jgi:hypothetical protein